VVKISFTLNVNLEVAVIGYGFRGLCIVVTIYICSSVYLQIRIGSIGSKNSRKTKTLCVKQIFLIFSVIIMI
jgi:hypothetical protein